MQGHRLWMQDDPRFENPTTYVRQKQSWEWQKRDKNQTGRWKAKRNHKPGIDKKFMSCRFGLSLNKKSFLSASCQLKRQFLSRWSRYSIFPYSLGKVLPNRMIFFKQVKIFPDIPFSHVVLEMSFQIDFFFLTSENFSQMLRALYNFLLSFHRIKT